MHWSLIRCVLRQGKVRAAPMVIGEIRSQDPAEMSAIEDDHVIQTLAANGPDDALDVRTLPRLERTRDAFGDAKTGDPPTHGVVVDGVPVSQQPPWGRVLREGF